MDNSGTARAELVSPNHAAHEEAEDGNDEAMDDEQAPEPKSSLAKIAAQNAQKRRIPGGSKLLQTKIPKLSVNTGGLQQQIEDLSKEVQKTANRTEAAHKRIEGIEKSQLKYSLKIEGIPPEVNNISEFLTELYSNGLKLERKITDEDFRDKRLISTKKGSKILILECSTYDLKMKTLKSGANLAKYLYDGKHKINIKDVKTQKDQKREFLAILTRKLIEVISRDHPEVLKKPDEKLKITRTDCLTSQHRPTARWDEWLKTVHNEKVLTSEEANSILEKIQKINNELHSM